MPVFVLHIKTASIGAFRKKEIVDDAPLGIKEMKTCLG
jgi:hypothetical protein